MIIDGWPARLLRTPNDRTLVVDANLREAFEPRDNADSSDLRRFVDRMLTQVPYVPDVVLAQEVNGSTAKNLAAILSAKTGSRYVVAANAGQPPITPAPGGQAIRDSAVLINLETMRRSGSGSNIAHDLERRHSTENRRIIKNTAVAPAQRRGGPGFAFGSVHTAPLSQVRDRDNDRLRGQWSDEMHRGVMRRSGEGTVQVLAGDFNDNRTRVTPEKVDGVPQPFVQRLLDRGYTDAIHERRPDKIGMRRIDYIFVRGAHVTEAARDWAYGDRERSDPKTYYSDHAFLWALIDHTRSADVGVAGATGFDGARRWYSPAPGAGRHPV